MSTDASDCLDEDAVLALIEGRLDEERHARIDLHVDGCHRCRAFIVAASALPAGATVDPDDVAVHRPQVRGTLLSRYLLLDVVGAGASGIVYAAYDPQLDRKVAIKVLRRRTQPGEEVASERVLREAQAMARLTHANVVSVHDVGAVDGRVFVVMEYVDGRTLAAWLAEAPRSWTEILHTFRLAGQGLAAAHDAGLVHRDFKPENVLYSHDGRVLVTDFGLARAAGVIDADGRRPPATAAALTQTGAVVGTPAYMAPEQLRGDAVDARSDLFSFCVALDEAFHGRRPFAGDSVEELHRAILAGDVQARLRPGGAPAWIQRILARGLSARPELRPASMAELLRLLGRDPARRRRRWGLAAAGLGLAAGIPLLVWHYEARASAPTQVCKGAELKLAGTWDPQIKEAVRASFLASGRAHAADTFVRAAAVLDDRAAAWVAMRGEACEATALRREQSAVLLDRRMECLDHRLGELRAQTQLFAHADGATVDNAVSAVYRLADLEPCADAHALLEAIPPPSDPATRERVALLRERLNQATALGYAGHYRDAEALFAQLVTEARALGYQPLVGEALLNLSFEQMNLYEDKAAQAGLEEALPILAAAKDDAGVATAWIKLINIIGIGQSRPAEALALRPVAETAIVRANGGEALRALLDRYLGSVLKVQGKYDEALALQRQALAIELRVLAPDHPDIAHTHNSIGVVLMHQGKLEEALTEYQETLAFFARTFGPDHPSNAGVLTNIGNLHLARGRWAEAAAVFERARVLQEKTLGPDHPSLADSLDNLGQARLELGLLDLARQDFERALAIRERKLPPEHVAIGASLKNLGRLFVAVGQPRDGEARLERALAIYEKAVDPGNLILAEVLAGLGDALGDQGRRDEAYAAYTRGLAIAEKDRGGENDETASLRLSLAALDLARGKAGAALAPAQSALAIRERLFGAEHPRVAAALLGVGEGLLALGRVGEAAPPIARAVHILEQQGTPVELAGARFAQARVLWSQTPRDADRAVALATDARIALAAAGAAGKGEWARVDRWLRDRDATTSRRPAK